MHLIFKTALSLMIACASLCGQTDRRPKFEVASVKPVMRQQSGAGIKGGPGTSDPGLMTYRSMSMRVLVQIAYEVHPIRLSEPSWMEDAYFDIVAKVPAGAAMEDRPFMLKQLLEERFKLTVHHESREMQAYALAAGKKGATMKAYPMLLPPDSSSVLKFQGADKDGIPFPAPGHVFGMQWFQDEQRAFIGAREPIRFLCDCLSGVLQAPVVDQTGLTGRYDFRLVFASNPSAAVATQDHDG